MTSHDIRLVLIAYVPVWVAAIAVWAAIARKERVSYRRGADPPTHSDGPPDDASTT